PSCGADTVVAPLSSDGDLDRTLAPEPPSNELSELSGTTHHDDGAASAKPAREPADATDFTLNSGGEPARPLHQTANLRGPLRQPEPPNSDRDSNAEGTLDIHTGLLLRGPGPSLGAPNKAADSRDPTVAFDVASKSAAHDTMAPYGAASSDTAH